MCGTVVLWATISSTVIAQAPTEAVKSRPATSQGEDRAGQVLDKGDAADSPSVAATKMRAVKGKTEIDQGWVKRHRQFVEKVKSGKVDLVFIGDSITQGWGDKKSRAGWPGSPLEVWRKYYGTRNAVNLGIGGDRTQHVLWRLENGEIDGIAPKLAVVMIGTNNVGRNAWEDVAAGVEKIAATLRAKLPNTKILLLGIFPRAKEKIDDARAKIAKINARIAKLDDGEHIIYRDIGAKFLDADGNLPDELLYDHLHLTAKGYELWAEAIEPDVAKLMAEKK
jgi:lysophospholipase L1-like esterase